MNDIRVTLEKVPHGRRASVVIVHDDGHPDTVRYLLGECEKHELCVTVALVGSRVLDTEGNRIPENIAFWQDMLDTGRFDISSHSRTHTFWGTTDKAESGEYLHGDTPTPYSIPAGKLTAEIQNSRLDLKAIFPACRLNVFVKPGGWTAIDGTKFSPIAKDLLHTTYIAMRDTGGGVTEIPFPDPYRINSHMVMPNQTAELWKSKLDEAIEKNALIVYLFHAILPENATGISVLQSTASELFAYIGEKQAAGEAYCTTLEEAVVYAEEYRVSKVHSTLEKNTLSLSLDCPLDPAIYDLPLTARVTLPDGSERFVSLPVNGDTVTITL